MKTPPTSRQIVCFYRSKKKMVAFAVFFLVVGIALLLMDLSAWLPDYSIEPYRGRITMIERFEALRPFLGWALVTLSVYAALSALRRKAEIVLSPEGLRYPMVLKEEILWDAFEHVVLMQLNGRKVLSIQLHAHGQAKLRMMTSVIGMLNRKFGTTGDFQINSMRIDGTVDEVAEAFARFVPVDRMTEV